MTKVFLGTLFIILNFALVRQARAAFIIPIPSLNVTVAVKDSANHQSVYIQDNANKIDYKKLNLAINKVIENKTSSCEASAQSTSAIANWLGVSDDCAALRFHPLAAVALPYNTFFSSSGDDSVALQIQGVTGTGNLNQTRALYIPLERLINRFNNRQTRTVKRRGRKLEKLDLEQYLPSAG